MTKFNFQKIKQNHLHHKAAFWGYFIFTALFIIRRLPFFMYFDIPVIGRDTTGYFLKAIGLMENFPVSFGIYPPGFPILIASVIAFFNNPFIIIWIQTILLFAVCVYTIHTFYIYYKEIAFVLSLALSLYIAETFTTLYSFSLLTESLYLTTLLLLTTLLIHTLKSPNTLRIILLSCAIVLPALVRSNGIYLYFLIFALIPFFYFNNFKKTAYIYILVPFLLINLLWSSYNYKTEGIFFPGNPGRIQNRIEALNNQDIKPEKKSNTKKNIIRTKVHFMYEYLGSTKQPRESLYSHYLINNYERLYLNRNSYFNFNEYEQKVLPHIFNTINKKQKSHVAFYNNLKNENLSWLIKLNMVYEKLHNFFLRNIIWIIIFYSISLIAYIKLFLSKFRNTDWFIASILSLFQILSILVLSLAHGRTLPRYIQVSEFIIYLIPILSIYLLVKEQKKKKTPHAPQ